jgi:hypothetical protein
MSMSDTEDLFFETENSLYLIKGDGSAYFRMPRAGTNEMTVRSHRLTYGEWHPLISYEVLANSIFGAHILHLVREDAHAGIFTTPIIRQGLARDYSE